jgi:hypothetical protein
MHQKCESILLRAAKVDFRGKMDSCEQEDPVARKFPTPGMLSIHLNFINKYFANSLSTLQDHVIAACAAMS